MVGYAHSLSFSFFPFFWVFASIVHGHDYPDSLLYFFISFLGTRTRTRGGTVGYMIDTTILLYALDSAARVIHTRA